MTASNIERFDEIVGKAFARLYGAFPLPVPLLVGIAVAEDNITDPMSGRLTDEAEFCIACLYWLRDAGYLSGEPDTFGLQGAVLTAKGLETLKAVPDSLNAKTPLGERIVQAVKTESGHAVRSLVSQALGIGMQWFVR